MTTQIVCSSINCTTAIRMDWNGHIDVQKRIPSEKRRIHIQPFYTEKGKKCIYDVASDVQKWSLDRCSRPYMITSTGSKWMEVESTRPYYKVRTGNDQRTTQFAIHQMKFYWNAMFNISVQYEGFKQ